VTSSREEIVMEFITQILQSPAFSLSLLLAIILLALAVIFLRPEKDKSPKEIDSTRLIQIIRACQKLPPS
jgi:hypothetical protein